jgi:hypothetical protein
MARYRKYSTEDSDEPTKYSDELYPGFGSSPYASSYAQDDQQFQKDQSNSSQYATSPKTAMRYPEVERVARERQQFENHRDYLMGQGMTLQDAEGKSYELLNAQKEANLAAINDHIESTKEKAKYDKDYSDFRARMAQIDYSNLNTAEEEINSALTEYSHLSGAHDPNIANAFGTISQNALKRAQSSYNAIARRLPQGIPVEAVLDESGRPSLDRINLARQGILGMRAESKGQEAGYVAAAKDPYARGLIEKRADEAIREQQETMPTRVEEARRKAEAVAPFKQKKSGIDLLMEGESKKEPSQPTKKLDPRNESDVNIAKSYLQKAKGDKQKARDLAREDGYIF